MDDYYLPPDQRDRDWESIPGGNMDLARFLREVLVPRGDGGSPSAAAPTTARMAAWGGRRSCRPAL